MTPLEFAFIRVHSWFSVSKRVNGYKKTNYRKRSATMSDAKDIWSTTFNAEQRADQEESDREAWRAIGFILMGIITIGLCLSFLAIFLVTH
jgi:hypothetical protein